MPSFAFSSKIYAYEAAYKFSETSYLKIFQYCLNLHSVRKFLREICFRTSQDFLVIFPYNLVRGGGEGREINFYFFLNFFRNTAVIFGRKQILSGVFDKILLDIMSIFPLNFSGLFKLKPISENYFRRLFRRYNLISLRFQF